MNELIEYILVNNSDNFRDFHVLIIVTIGFMVMDIFTGILKSLYNKEYASSISKKGLIKKIGWLSIIIAFSLLSFIIDVKEMMIFASISSMLVELTSIIENFSAIGIDLKVITRFFKKE